MHKSTCGFKMVWPIMYTSMDKRESFPYHIENIIKDRNQIQQLGS